MRRLAWLPVAFGAVLVILAGAVDRSLARLTREEVTRAVAEVEPDQLRASRQLTATLRQLQDALERGETPVGLHAWSVQRPPSAAAGGASEATTDRAALAPWLSSRGVTANGMPKAIVAALALGDASAMKAVGEDLAAGRLPVRAEDVATLGMRLGLADDPRLGELEAHLRSLPPGIERMQGWHWSLHGSRIEGMGVPGTLVLHADAEVTTLLAAAGLDGRARIVPRAQSGTCALDAIDGAAISVAPDVTGTRRLRAWRALTWVAAAVAVALALMQARLVQRESALAAREREFVTNVTHELRTPLAALRAMGETLEVGRGDPAQYGALIADETRRLEALVERVLASARAGAKPCLAECAPENIARRALDLVRTRAAHHDVQLVESIAAGLPATRWDEEAVCGAVANLLENAIKHGKAAGHVELSVHLAGDHIAIRVKDDGPGIARRDKSRLFRRFERGMTDAPGAGLGLSLVEQVASTHGGSVELESSPGNGCAFTLMLPVRVA